MTDTITADKADRLLADRTALETAVMQLRDSITGAWQCDGDLYVPEVAAGAQSVLDSLGRLANTLEKAADFIHAEASHTYIDVLGEQTDATEDVQLIAATLRDASRGVMALHTAYAPLCSKLGSLGERE